ncbi:MAG: matrixin family metalloprotease, partial [Armatimonadota bacterium]
DSINQVDNTRDVTDVYLIRSQIAGQGSIDRAQYVSTVTHEMGHALGMIGHSSDPNDIMYPTIGPLEVSQKDINTVATLYRSYFDGGNTIP